MISHCIIIIIIDRVTKCVTFALFISGAEDLNSVPHTCTAGTLSAEPSLQPRGLLFKGAVDEQSLTTPQASPWNIKHKEKLGAWEE